MNERKKAREAAKASGVPIKYPGGKFKKKDPVAPKIGSKVKLDKMLAKSMKTLSIGDKRKINMEDSSSGDEDDGDMNVDQVVPMITTKKIKKVKMASMAMQKMMKKNVRRLRKCGNKKAARKLEEKRMTAVEQAMHNLDD